MSKISVILPILTSTPFLRAMTEFAIKALRLNADNPFELVVVEADGNYFDPSRYPFWTGNPDHAGHPSQYPNYINKYLNFTPKIGAIKETNAAIDAATGDFIVTTGNDLFVPPHWDTELLRIFEARKDCGIASLSAWEAGATVGPPQSIPYPEFVEGMYSPFTMFRKGWRLDESYHKIYQDSDLVMRMYEAGLRAYRSNRTHVHHLLRMTSANVETEQHKKDLAHDERLFYQRWSGSPLWMFGMIRSGMLVYGHEYEAWLKNINLHFDPTNLEG